VVSALSDRNDDGGRGCTEAGKAPGVSSPGPVVPPLSQVVVKGLVACSGASTAGPPTGPRLTSSTTKVWSPPHGIAAASVLVAVIKVIAVMVDVVLASVFLTAKGVRWGWRWFAGPVSSV